MDEEELHREYEIAVELYKDGEYANALVLLNRIAKERPDSKHVMYTRGLCFIGLGRIGEARVVRDQLSGRGSSARQLTAKLDAKLHNKIDELEKESQKGSNGTKSSLSAISEARSPHSLLMFAIILIVVVALGAVGFYVYAKHIRPMSGADAVVAMDPEVPFTGVTPDEYMECATFFPIERDVSFQFAVALAPSPESLSNESTDVQDDCVGNAIVSGWPELKPKMKKALAMSHSSDEMLKGAARNTLVATIVLPRAGQQLSGMLSGKNIETFTSTASTNVADVVKSCGEPKRKETWSGLGACVGLLGEVQWWGRIGLAAGADGQITHVLLQAYPGDIR
jgi:hypothetical protein